jgi:hypothetical protein
MMNPAAAELVRAYRSIGCSWAKIGKKFGISRQQIQELLSLEMPAASTLRAQPAFSRSALRRKDV